MKAPEEQLDYGIYIDHVKAFIISVNEFDRTQPIMARIELNPDTEAEETGTPTKEMHSAYLLRMKEFTEKVIGLLTSPHRVVLFGPSEEKYELHKELQTREGYDQVLKELIVSDTMNEASEAQAFTEKYFLSRGPF